MTATTEQENDQLAKVRLLARTKWHHVSATMVRPCVQCGVDYPSTCPADRICPDCNHSIAAARARAAIVEEPGIRELTDGYFDQQSLDQRGMARAYDSARRAARQHAILVRQGRGGTPEALELLRRAGLRKNVYIKMADDNDGEAKG